MKIGARLKNGARYQERCRRARSIAARERRVLWSVKAAAAATAAYALSASDLILDLISVLADRIH
ncbi:hypothetical protein ACD578_27985 (plasmid) [Microvirga sp. RSM25]|uniref:hypothetical protein n=1 Tax=Microvirga sp. RSM25 TaxID=3273802 RepID=UPI00384BEC9E